MKYNEIMPECYIDSTFVSSLLDANVNHKHSCNEVAREMERGKYKDAFAVGIIDNDKRKLSYIEGFEVIGRTDNMTFLKHNDKHHYIIKIGQAHKAMETFIKANVEAIGMKMEDFDLPSDLAELVEKTKDSMYIYDTDGTTVLPLRKFDSITFSLGQIVTPTIGDDYMSICDNELPYTWQGVTFTEAGVQMLTLQTPQGNDSIVMLHLTVYPTQTGHDYMTVCPNALPYIWQGVTFTGAGTQSITLHTIHGCDSIVTLHLTVSDNIETEFWQQVCDSYTWNGTTYSTSGNYTQTFTSSHGCDSIVTLHLTISDDIQTEFSREVCESFTWNGTTYSASGNYTQTFTSVQGCDSIVTLHLTVYHTQTGDDYMTICENELPYIWQGVVFTAAGTRTVTLQTAHGCDSIVTLHLTVNQSQTGNDYLEICENELPYTWQGVTFTTAETHTVTLPSAQGCDSIVTLHLTVNPTQTSDDYLTVTENELPYTWQGVTFTGEGTQTVTLQTIHGCDSIVTLHLTVTAAPVGDTVYITYNGSSVSVINPFANTGVTVTNSGADVTVNSTRPNVPYVVSGNSSNGSLTMNSTNGFFMALSSLSLTSTNAAAINIASQVDVTLQLRGNSTLADGANSLINGALYAAGDLTISGGLLNITGNAKHGILVDGNMTVNSGTIHIIATDSDGIHGSSNLVWNNGTLEISSAGSDGLDFSGTVTINNGDLSINTTTESQRGIKVTGIFTMTGGTLNLNVTGNDCKGIKGSSDVLLNGGTIVAQVSGTGSNGISSDTNVSVSGANVTVVSTSEDGKCLKSDGTFSMSSGSLNLTHSGNASKGISTVGNSTISGGTIGINANGTTMVVNNESSYCTAIKSDANITISGGNFTLTLPTANQNGKAISADGNIAISGGTLTLNISGSNSNGISADVNVAVSGTADITITTSALDGKGIKSDGTIDITGGTIHITHSGNTSKGISADGDINIGGGTIVINANGNTVVTSNDPSYCTAIKGDANITISGGNITINLPTSNQGGKGIKCSGNMTISGDNTINIETHGDGATYTASSGTDTYSSSCLRAEGNMQIQSGNITLTSTGKAGKGIKVGTKSGNTYSGTYTQGNSNGTGPTLTISTSGAQLGGGGGGGWPPGPGGGSSSTKSSSKAIKVGGIATINGGNTTINTTTTGAEGLESKTQIDVNGGQHYFHCYDDCMNSAGTITFNGGVTVCFSNGNDAIDSNAGRAGAITIGNGVAFAYTTKGSPEEGFDCDNNNYIRITGTGIGISAGGSQGGGPGGGGSSNTIPGAVQGYYFRTSSYSFQAGRYYTLSNTSGSGGTNLVTFSFEANCTSTLSLITATGMQHSSTYYVKYGNQAPTNPTTAFHGLYLGGTSSASTQAFSFTAQ